MADISKIKTLDGTIYDIKDLTIRRAHGFDPIETKTYTDVIATADNNNGAGFFYLKVRANSYNDNWHVKTRVKATVPGQINYNTDTIFDIWGYTNTYSWYACLNRIRTTSYRPIYYNSLFRVSETGYNNECGNWIGFNLRSSTNNTNTSYKRQIIVELLEYDNCTVELQDNLITPTNIPNRAEHTNWYTSSNTSFENFDAANYGLKQSGDANTTSISNLYDNNSYFIANSVVYRYQMLFQIDENILTPLNNNSNTTGTTKTMLTNIEFDPFKKIYYYNSTTTTSAQGNISGAARFWAFNGVDLRYTFNCGQTLTAYKPLYLVVTPTNNGKCKLANATPWAQELPTTDNGYWYILLGRTYSSYQMVLYSNHPVYYHDGNSIKEILSTDILGNATTVNGHTVNKNVPSDAKFTDTTYESKPAVSGGTDLSLVTTGEKYNWNNASSGGVTNVAYDTTNKKITKTIGGTTSDIVTVSTLKTDMSLNNVDNTADANKSVASAEKLTSGNYIDGVLFDGSSEIVHYGICNTAANEATKTVTITGFSLKTGAIVYVKFTNNNTTIAPTLNVNSTGAKPIYMYGMSQIFTSDYTYGWFADDVVPFVYDGTSWVRPHAYNSHRRIEVNGEEVFGNSGTSLNLASGSNTNLSYSNGTVTVNSTDTNTHRPIQVNNSEILGNTTTPLNLKEGSHISISNSVGDVTIGLESDYITTQSFTATSATTVNGNSNANATITITKSGYTPLGIMSINKTGTQNTTSVPIAWYLGGTTSAPTATVTWRNLANSTATLTTTIVILYRKN